VDFRSVEYRPGVVARVILNRPERHNAQSLELLTEMEQAFNAAVEDPKCRVIVLSGAGRSFSAGHDLRSPEHVEQMSQRLSNLDPFPRSSVTWDVYVNSHLRWRDLQKPTIAMVHGWCIFGGWMIAAAMDFIFAAEDAKFIPVYGDYFTAPWDVGPRRAKQILFGNHFIGAGKAMEWGFVNEVFPPDELEAETLKYAERVAEHDSFTLRQIKFAINQTMDGMGFTQSVRAVGGSFIRRPGNAADGSSTGQRMQSQVDRAMAQLREDSQTEES